MPKVSGTWRDTAIYYNGPTPLHVADPRHGKEGHEPGPGDYGFEAPPYPYAQPMGKEDFGSSEVPDIRGLEIDRTDYRDHSAGSVGGLYYTGVADLDQPGGADWDSLKHSHAAHDKDEGASTEQNYSERTFKFWDERYLFFRIPGMGEEVADTIPAIAYGAPARALNSLSVNNPPLESYFGHGFWPGTTEQAVVDRKFQARIIQRHDERAQTPNLPYFELNAPPPRPGNQSTTPFSALQRMVSSVQKIALARRTPPVPGDIEEERAREDSESPTVEASFYG